MQPLDETPTGKSRGRGRAVRALLAALLILAVPVAAEAHGKQAVPSDPALLEQYRAGLVAYLNRDYQTALEKWRSLAERKSENSAAQIFLGLMYANGQGIDENRATAAEWYRRAAMQDNMLAQIRLGFMYRRGDGVARDPVEAYLWASLAAREESHVQATAQALQEALSTEMTPEQIAEAERRTAQWVEAHGAGE